MRNFENSKWRPPPSWFYQNVRSVCVDWAFWLRFELHMPRHDRSWKIASQMRNSENQRWQLLPSRICQKMLITSAWFELFGWNLNFVYLGITAIGKFHQKCEIYKIQDGGGHLGVTKMLAISTWIGLFGWDLNCIYTGRREIGKYYQKCEILKNPRWRRPPSWIYKNIDNFRVVWGFWLQFELRIPWHNRNWKISSEMPNF